ncbi:MAG TPA: hypothetical protein VHQ24_09130 [Lachnospiraceae bacterium]|nr:hypothetical protein [Lachnospiraceae bacterium]
MAQFNFTDGQGQFTDVPYGTRTLDRDASVITGYNKATLPATVNVDGSATPIALTVGATGTFTIRAFDMDTHENIAGVQFIRVYKDYASTKTTYGNPTAITGASGETKFYNVPYDINYQTNIYFALVDTSHYILRPDYYPNGFITYQLSVPNVFAPFPLKKIVDQDFTITDNNYSGLPIESGTISLS